MSRENIYKAIILKKQPFGEGDEIFTVFTQELGKIRALGKSTKLAKSKLQYSLQTGFYIKLTLTGSKMPKIIGSETLNTFYNIRENLAAVGFAFYALEAVLKSTPDEQKNELLFDLLLKFLTFLDLCKTHEDLLPLGLVKFKIDFLTALGLGIRLPTYWDKKAVSFGFSITQGNFAELPHVSDSRPVKLQTMQQFAAVELLEFSQLFTKSNLSQVLTENLSQLQDLLSDFIHYQLEREIRSERFLT